jgi:hypothetical protein
MPTSTSSWRPRSQTSSAEVRRRRSERRKLGALGLAELMVEARAEEIVEVFFKAIAQGDWRAGAALLERVYGRPEQKLEVAQPQSVEDVEKLSLAEIRALRLVSESGPE